MLKQGHRLIRRHIQAVKHSLNAFKRAPWTTVVTVLVIAVTLILPLLFWLLMGQLKPLANDWRQGKEISLYLDTSLTSADETDVMGRIQATKGVETAVFISAEMSLAELEKQEGMEDVRRYLPLNPLPSTTIGFMHNNE